MDSIKDVVRSSVMVPEFDKNLKAGRHMDRNVVEITVKLKTTVRKPLMVKIIKLRLRNVDNESFAIFICFSYGSLINCDNFVTIKHKSGLVVVIAFIKLPTIFLYNFPSANLLCLLDILLILDVFNKFSDFFVQALKIVVDS